MVIKMILMTLGIVFVGMAVALVLGAIAIKLLSKFIELDEE